MTSPYLTDDDFAARTIMAPADVERLQGFAADRGVADSLPADLTAESPIGVAKYAANVLAVKFYPDLSLASDPVNYATISFYKRAADGTRTLVAVVDTSAQGWTQGIPVRLAISAPAVLVDETFTYAITKHGTGVVVPTGRFVAKLSSNFITTRLAINTSYINARLSKRYVVPFLAPVPEVVLKWLTDMTTKDGFDRRGRNSTSAEDQEAIDAPAKLALDELKEAADAEKGLFDLPIRDDMPGKTGIAKGAPFAYSETSPYVSMDLQRSQGRNEDASGIGDAIVSLATFVSKIRALANFDFDVAKEAAPLVQDAVRAQARAGAAPDGSSWKSKKDGGKPLRNAADHLTAKSIGNTIEIELTGPEVFHNAGNGRLPKRQILPDDGKIPGYIADAMHEGAKRAFEKRGGS